MEDNVQLKPKPSVRVDVNANNARSKTPNSTRHESIAHIKGGVPIKRITIVSPARRAPPTSAARSDPLRTRGKNFGSSKQVSPMPNKPVQKTSIRPILKKGSSASLQQNPYPMRALAKREMSTKELYRGQLSEDQSSGNLDKSSSMIHRVRNPLSSCSLHRMQSRKSGVGHRKLSSADEIILHHTNPFLEDLILQKRQLKSVQSVHVQTEEVPNYSPLLLQLSSQNHSSGPGPEQRMSIVGSGRDLASLLPSHEKLSLGRSEQIYSWIPTPQGHGQQPPLDSIPPAPLLRYLDPLIHETPPSYRLDPDLSRVPDFWDKPPTPPPNLQDCFVDSKSMDAFMTHVLGGARAGSYQRLTKSHPSASSNSLQSEGHGQDSKFPIFPARDVGVEKLGPKSCSTVSTRASSPPEVPEVVTTGLHAAHALPHGSSGIQISFNYSPGYDWEAEKHFHKRSAYFPRLFGRNSSAVEMSRNAAPVANPTPEQGSTEEPAAPTPKTTSASLPVVESLESRTSTSSTSTESYASAPGIRNVILDKFFLEIPPYSVPQDKTTSLVSESSSRTYTKEGGDHDATPPGHSENYAVQIEITSSENERPALLDAAAHLESTPPTDPHPKAKAQTGKDNIFIGTISKEELQLDQARQTEPRPSGIHLNLQSELEHWSKALLEQPGLAHELSQSLDPELTLGQRICAIIDMSNDKSSRLGLKLKDELLQQLNRDLLSPNSRQSQSQFGQNENEVLGSDARSTTSTYTLSPRGHRVHFDDSETVMTQAQDKHIKQSDSSHTPRSRHDIHNMHCSAGSEYAMLAAAREQQEERARREHHLRSRSPSGPRFRTSRSRSTPSQSAIHKVLVKIQDSASRMTTPRVPPGAAVVNSRRSSGTSLASGSATASGEHQRRDRGRPSSQQSQRRP